MTLRKINAGISLITTVLLMNHAIFNAVRMLSQSDVEKSGPPVAWILALFMMLHAILSIYMAIDAHAGVENGQAKAGTQKIKSYPKMMIPTVIQRMSGVLLIVFSAFHIAGAGGAMKPPFLVHVILPPLFFTLAMAHVSVSVSKAFITLGIGNARVVKVVDVVTKVLCAATLLASLTGFYLHAV